MADIVQGAYDYLVSKTALTNLLGTSSPWTHWLFQDEPRVQVESTGKAAVILSHEGSWTSPNRHNTARFPRLLCLVMADSTRQTDGSPAADDARGRASAIVDQLDLLLHLPDLGADGGFLSWGAAFVFGSHRLDEPEYLPVPEAKPMVQARCYYGVSHA